MNTAPMNMSQPDGRNPLDVVAVGACSPAGLCARVIQREAACGTMPFSLAGITDQADEPVRAALVTALPEGAARTERLQALAATAMAECLRRATKLGECPRRLPTILALPDVERAGTASPGATFDANAVLATLQETAGQSHTELTYPRGAFLPAGRAGFFEALAAAWSLVVSQGGAVLIGAVDSHCDWASLRCAVENNRVMGSNNPDGVIPGEGAAFVLVSRRSSEPGSGLRPASASPRPRLVAFASGQEPRPFSTHSAVSAAGLTAVFSSIRNALPPRPDGSVRVDYLVSCQTGESYWDKEFSFAYLRNGELLPEPLRLHLAAKAHGDAGVAAGGLQLVQALYLCERHGCEDDQPGPSTPSPPPPAPIYGCADTGAVGACVLEATAAEAASTVLHLEPSHALGEPRSNQGVQ